MLLGLWGLEKLRWLLEGKGVGGLVEEGVVVEVRLEAEGEAARGALEGQLVGVAFEVRLERRDLREALLANVALVRPRARVRQQVLLERARAHKVAAAHLANVRTDVQVRLHVRRHALPVAETLAAHVARQRHRPPVRLEVNQKQVPSNLFVP